MMVKWLELTTEQRNNTLNIITAKTGLPKAAIEKDWWVTLALKAIFNCAYANALVFKGGTSLSKGWQLIDRFSEDIDLAIDRAVLGFDNGEYSKSRVKRLKRIACAFISSELMAALKVSLADLGVPEEQYLLEAAEVQDPDKDPQQLYLKYKSLEEADGYLTPQVIIEVSARSLTEPAEIRQITSMIDEEFSIQPFSDKPFPVLTTMVKRTFLEKILLLHEEFQKPKDKIRSTRMTRHLYDLERIMNTHHGKQALADEELYQMIVEHRKTFNLLPHVDLALYEKRIISFLPPANLLAIWEQDYREMQQAMFYGNSLSFIEMIKRLQDLQKRLNSELPT